MDEPNAIGHAFNIANARPLSQMEAVEAFAKACKKPVKFVRIPREYILRAGGHPMGPKLYFGFYFDMPPITQVTAKAQRVLKFKPVDFAAGLKETYKWYLRHNEFPKPDYEFEDKLLVNAPVMIPAKVVIYSVARTSARRARKTSGSDRFDLRRDQADRIHVLNVHTVFHAEAGQLHANEVGDRGKKNAFRRSRRL